MTTVGIEQAQSNLVELVESVTRGDHVELVPVNLVSGKSKIKPGFGGAKGLISVSHSFDAPISDFKDFTE